MKANQDYIVDKSALGYSLDLSETERQLVENERVFAQVLMDPGLRETPSLSEPETAEQNLRENLSIESARDPAILVISYTDTDREAAAKVCNAITDSYLMLRDDFESRRIGRLEKWLEPQVVQLKRKVEEQSKLVAQLTREITGTPGTRLGADERQMDLDLAAELRRMILSTEIDLAVQENLASEGPTSNTDTPAGTAEDVPSSDARADQAVQRLKVKLEILNEKYDSIVKRLSFSSGHSVTLEFAKDDLSRTRELLHRVTDRLESIQLESKRGSAVISIAQATPPTMPVDSIPYRRIALAGGIGFLFPQFLSLMLGGCYTRPKNE